MLGTLIGIIFALVFLGVIWWAAQRLLALVPMAEPIRTIVHVLIVVIGALIVLWILSGLLALGGIPVRWPRLA